MTLDRACEILRKSGEIEFEEMEMQDHMIFLNAITECAVHLEPLVEKYCEAPVIGKKVTFLAQIK